MHLGTECEIFSLTPRSEMDPLSALSIASTVAQFVGYAITIAARLSEYSAASPNEAPRAMHSINARLPLLLSALSRLKNEDEVSHFDTDARCILRGVISGCMRVVEEIDEMSKKLVPQPGENMKTKLKKVLSTLNTEEKINAIDRNLQAYIQILILHHVVENKDFEGAALHEGGFFEVKERLVSSHQRREKLVDKLDACFYGPIRRQTDTPQIAVLAGRPGSGKTQLAAGYCREAYDLNLFHLVFWLDASSPEAYQTSLQSAAVTIKHSKEGDVRQKFEFFQQFLTKSWEPWLLVLDNYNSKVLPENELLSYLPHKGYGAIIVISHSEEFNAPSTVIKIAKYLNEHENEQYRQQMSGAVERSNLEVVESIVPLGFDVNQNKTSIGWSFLARASLMGSEPIVKMLLENGADHIAAPCGWSSLLAAAYDGHTGVVTILLDHEDKTQRFLEHKEYRDAALKSISEGRMEAARAIITRRDIKLSGSIPELGRSLSSAVRKGNLDTVKFLASIGALPSEERDRGNAIIAAIDTEHVEVAKYLLGEGGFSVDAADQYGKTGLIAASELQSSNQGPLRAELVTLFLSLGANVNLRTSDGSTAINGAALRGKVDTVTTLLAAGADPLIPDNLGYTPLLSASKYKSPEVFPVLTDIPIPDPEQSAEYFESALFFSARNGDRELLAAIIDKVRDLNAIEDHSGETPLTLCVRRNHAPVARYLIRRGADASFKNRNDEIPMILAAEKGLNLVVRDLSKAKKNPCSLEVKDAKGNTPLHLAVAANQLAVVEDLVSLGADVEAENKFGEIPMDIAEEKKLKDVIKALNAVKV